MKKAWALSLLGVFLLAAHGAWAGIPVPVPTTGSRSTTAPPGGVAATGGYTAANGGITITWNITFDGTFYNYSYTFTNADGSTPIHPDISHWIVEISEEIPAGDISEYIFDANAPVVAPPGGNPWPADPIFPNQTQQGANGGNPNLGTDLYGVKFDTGSQNVGGTYTFKSIEPPVWGDFYVK